MPFLFFYEGAVAHVAGFRAEGSGQYAPNVKATLCPPKPKELVNA